MDDDSWNIFFGHFKNFEGFLLGLFCLQLFPLNSAGIGEIEQFSTLILKKPLVFHSFISKLQFAGCFVLASS